MRYARWILALAAPGAAYAHRPLDGTDATAVDLGDVELEAAPLQVALIGGEPVLAAPTVAATVGFGRVEVGATGTSELSLFEGGGAGWAVAAQLKAVVREGSLQGRSGPSLAAQMQLAVLGFGEDAAVAAVTTGALSHRVGRAIVHLNVDLVQERDLDLAGGVALVAFPDDKLQPLVELRGATVGPTTSGLVGFLATIGSVVLDGAAKAGVTDAGALYEVRAGVTWVVP